jgi:hypothetical protein
MRKWSCVGDRRRNAPSLQNGPTCRSALVHIFIWRRRRRLMVVARFPQVSLSRSCAVLGRGPLRWNICNFRSVLIANPACNIPNIFKFCNAEQDQAGQFLNQGTDI